jgi:glycosyltransferase involved in cell wall biosynthesis
VTERGNSIRILLSIHHPLTPDLGAPGVTYQLAKHFEGNGSCSRVLSFSTMPAPLLLRSPLLQQVRFPWYMARQLTRLAGEFDVADCSSGDGWVYQAFRRENLLLTVARSHGLEHIVDSVFREEVASGKQQQSWKYPLYHGGYRLWEVARSFRTADLSIFPNQGDLDYAVEHLGVKADKSAIVPNGIPDEFAGLPLRDTNRTTDRLRVAIVGSYSHRKINVAPQALNRVLHANPALQIGFLGTGISEDAVLRDYSPEYHERVKVLPRYSHSALPSLLADYDVLLFPSLSEGFGLVVYEAMACGLAVVATDLDALQTYLKHEEDVLFIARNSPEAIEAALSRLIREPGLLSHLQRQGWLKAQRFAWSKVAAQTKALYTEFIARKAA